MNIVAKPSIEYYIYRDQNKWQILCGKKRMKIEMLQNYKCIEM